MSKVHILAGNGGTYQIIIHTNTPTIGNNAIGNNWKTCYINAGLATTSVMSVGIGLGQITSSEAASVLSGDMLEISTTIPNRFDGATPTPVQINAFADAVIASRLDD